MTAKKQAKPTLTPRAGSLTDTLMSLAVGQEHPVVRHLNPDEQDFSEDGISQVKTRLNSTVSSTITRIREVTGRTYSVEGAVFSTTRNRLYAALIVTRDT